jgi:hypothetical protein
MWLGRQGVRFASVAPWVREDKVVSKVARILREWNEMVNVGSGQVLLTIEALATVHFTQALT